MKICVLTGYQSEGQWKAVGDFTSAINTSFSVVMGYTEMIRHDVDTSRPGSWSKVRWCLDALKAHDLVMWIDADAVVCRRFNIESVAHGNDFTVCRDNNGINCGWFILRSSPWTKMFLETVWDSVGYIHHHWWEQAAVHEMHRRGLLEGHVNFVGQDFNSYRMTPTNCVLHAAGISLDRKLDFLRPGSITWSRGLNVT